MSTYRMSSIIYRQMFTFWKRISFLYQFSTDYKQRKHALQVLQDNTKRVIAERRVQLDAELDEKRKMVYTEDEPDLASKRRFAFLDSILVTQRETGLLTETNIEEEVNTFMFAVSIFIFNFSSGTIVYIVCYCAIDRAKI